MRPIGRQPSVGGHTDGHAEDEQDHAREQARVSEADDEQPRASRQQQGPRQTPAGDHAARRTLGRWTRGAVGHGAGDRRDRQQRGQRDQRQEAQEDEPPAGMLGDEAADRRADDPGHDPGRRQDGEHPRTQAQGQGPSDRDVGDRRDPPSAETLEQAGCDQDRHRRCQTTDQEAQAEEAQADRQRPHQAAPIDQAPEQDDPDEVAQEERTEDPAVQLDLTELAGDDRHRGRDRQRFERYEGDRQDEPEREPPPAGREEPARIARRVR